MIIMFVALGLYVGVPVVWYGAVEFGLVHPIRTPEFKSALQMAGLVLLLVFLSLYTDHLSKSLKKEERKPKADVQQLPPAA